MVFKKFFKLYLNKCHVTSNLVDGQIWSVVVKCKSKIQNVRIRAKQPMTYCHIESF